MLIFFLACSLAAVDTSSTESVDDSAWIVRAVCEKLVREWDSLHLGAPVPDLVRELASRPAASARAESGARAVALSLAGR